MLSYEVHLHQVSILKEPLRTYGVHVLGLQIESPKKTETLIRLSELAKTEISTDILVILTFRIVLFYHNNKTDCRKI